MKLEYKIEPILFHLKHIKRMCLENGDCTGCPFNLVNKYDEISVSCMFSNPQLDDGTIPEDWDLEQLEKEDDKDGQD